MAQRYRPDRSHHDLGYSPQDDDRGRYASGLQRDDYRRAPRQVEGRYGRDDAGPDVDWDGGWEGGPHEARFGGVDARGRSDGRETTGKSYGPAYGVSGASSTQDYWRSTPRRQPPPRGPHRGHGPKGYARSDERLREAICERLMDDPDIDAREITVEVKDGVVTLEGHVDNRLSKHIIEDLVDACGGVRDIRNLIAVRPSGGPAQA